MAEIPIAAKGSLWHAENRHTGTRSLVRLLPDACARQSEVARRVEVALASVWSLSDHPNIASLKACWLGGTTRPACVVLEELEGETLRERLNREGSLPPLLAEGFASDLAEALQAIHGQGLFHGALSADKVFLTKDRTAKVLDLGLGSVWPLPDPIVPAYEPSSSDEGGNSSLESHGQAVDINRLGLLISEMVPDEQDLTDQLVRARDVSLRPDQAQRRTASALVEIFSTGSSSDAVVYVPETAAGPSPVRPTGRLDAHVGAVREPDELTEVKKEPEHFRLQGIWDQGPPPAIEERSGARGGRAARQILARVRPSLPRLAGGPRALAAIVVAGALMLVAIVTLALSMSHHTPRVLEMPRQNPSSRQASAVTVPSVAGFDVRTARIRLSRAGLVLAGIKPGPGRPGMVVTMTPPPGLAVPPGTTVWLTVGVDPNRLRRE